MRLIFTFARGYPRASVLMVAALLLAGLAEGIGISTLLPLLNTIGPSAAGAGEVSQVERIVTDGLSVIGLTPTLGVLLTVIVVGVVLKSGLILLAERQVGYTVAHVATDLRLALIQALVSTRWEYYLRQPVGVLTNAVATEATRAATAFRFGADIVAYSIQVAVYTTVVLFISWQATLAAVLVSGIFLYLLRRLIHATRRAGTRQTVVLKSLLTRLTDNLRSVKPLKAMAREDLAGGLLQREIGRLNRALQKQVFSEAALAALQEPLLAVLLAVGVYLALTLWGLSLASVVVLVFLIARVLTRMNKIQRQYQRMMSCESAYWSLQETIDDAIRESEGPLSGSKPALEREIRLHNIGFHYGSKWVLRRLSLVIPARAFTAIVGASGVGKTTLVDLLVSLLRPQEGEIRVDGVPLPQIDRHGWRRLIGYVPQDPVLLFDTVLYNVLLGDPELTRADAEWALKAAGVWEVVSSLPEGLDSNIGERGGRLSQGQQQRLAIARALAHRPELLILDEATSALDSETEAAICRQLEPLRAQMTIIAISHRAALVDIADHVYRLHDGEVTVVRNGGPFETTATGAGGAGGP